MEWYVVNDLHSLQVEASVLSCFMFNIASLEYITDMQADWFHAGRHQILFNTCETLYKRGDVVDVITIHEEIQKSLEYSKIVTEQFLMDFTAKNYGAPHAMPSYLDILRKQWVKRNAMSTGKRISDLAHNVDMTTEELVNSVHTLAQSVESGKLDNWQKSAIDCIADLIPILEKRSTAFLNNEPVADGIKTGFVALDNKLSYVDKNDFVVIGARPSMGKTTFAQNIIADIAINQCKPVLFMSAEMPAQSIIERITSQIGSIPLANIRNGNLTEYWDSVVRAGQVIQHAPIEINDQPMPSVFDLRKAARAIVQKYGSIGAIFVDYLQLMKPHTNFGNPVKDIGEVSKELKATAKLFDCPVFALSQLSRAVDSRTNNRPVNSDLRESGQIEQDADIIIMLYRDEVYKEDSKDMGIAEVIITKCRNGSIGTIRLASSLHKSCFEDLAHEYGVDEK